MTQAWRLALRDLRAGGRRLWLLALCLFLGTAALAGIGSLSASVIAALDDQSRASLGGDLELRVSQRLATVEEAAAFAEADRVSDTVRMRAMARSSRGGTPVLVTLKAVDDAWPLVGRMATAPGARAPRPHGAEVAIAPALADRMGLRIGDVIGIGSAHLTVIGLLTTEPDRLGEGFSLGPLALVDRAGLDATGLVQPGSLYETRVRLMLPPGANARAIGERLLRRFPNAGWTIRTPDGATDALRRTITQLGQFLLLIGLAALAIAGVGVGSGVTAYLERKTRMIATLKVLGAHSRTIAGMFILQLALVAGGSIAAGLALGAALPAIVAALVGDALPVLPKLALYPQPLLVAAGLSLLVTALFALPALARARSVPAATLLRDAIAPVWRLSLAVLTGMALLVMMLVLLAVLTASDGRTAFGFVAATGGLILLLWAIGIGLRRVLARLPAPRRPLLRLALANLHRPGAATDRLIMALGLGFALFVALAVIDTSLSSEITRAAPAKAPRFFAIDLQAEDAARFRSAVAAAAPDARIEATPSLRGAIVGLKGVRVADMKTLPEGAWILRGDRTITWSATIPPRNTIVAGRWWPATYRGPPLVSLEDKAAELLGLKVGDQITVAVLGVDVPARIAALRHIEWGAMGLNFAIVFSPGYIEEAPHGLLASIYSAPGEDGAIARAVGDALPSVSMIRTGDVITQIGDLLGQIGLAVRAAAAVTVAAGLCVLVGAVTASGQARRYEVAILKLLGASRRQVQIGQAIEFGLLSALLVGVALIMGGTAGWYVVTQVLTLAWAPDPMLVALTLGVAIAITVGVGLLGNLAALAAKPAALLRDG